MPLADTLDAQEVCVACDAPLALHELDGQAEVEVNGESLCDACWDIWKAEMQACAHVFESGTCQKCGFVPNTAV